MWFSLIPSNGTLFWSSIFWFLPMKMYFFWKFTDNICFIFHSYFFFLFKWQLKPCFTFLAKILRDNRTLTFFVPGKTLSFSLMVIVSFIFHFAHKVLSDSFAFLFSSRLEIKVFQEGWIVKAIKMCRCEAVSSVCPSQVKSYEKKTIKAFHWFSEHHRYKSITVHKREMYTAL